MATAKQVATRAWELRSGWFEHAAVVVVAAVAVWAFDWSWWAIAVGWLVIEPGMDVTFAWLSLRGDTAEQEQAEPAGEGD